MFDRDDVNRIIDLAHAATLGELGPEGKGELRSILSRYAPGVADLDWAGVMESAEFVVGVYVWGSRHAAEAAGAS